MTPRTARRMAAIALGASGVACQALSGVGDLEFVDPGDASASGGSGGVSGGGAGGVVAGAAGAAGIGGAPPGPQVAWVWGLHGSGAQTTSGVHRTLGGDVIVAGYFTGELVVEGAPAVASTASDLFLARRTAAGPLAWLRTFVGAGDQYLSSAIAVDDAGTIFGAGMFRGTLPFIGFPLTNAETNAFDAFIVRFTNEGIPNSAFQLGGSATQATRGRVALHGGSPVIAGTNSGSTEIAGVQLTSKGSEDGFVSRLYSGVDDWAFSFGDELKQTVLDVHSNGTLIAFTGEAHGSFTVEGLPVASAGGSDVLLGITDGTGAIQAVKVYGDAQVQAGDNVFLTQDAIYLTGRFSGVLDLDGQVRTSDQGSDLFVSRHELNGNCVWAKAFGGLGALSPEGLHVSPSGDVYVVGTFNDALDFGQGLVTPDGVDAVILRLDSAGKLVWALPLGGPGNDGVSHVSQGAGSQILVSGSFNSELWVLAERQLTRQVGDTEPDGFVLAIEP